MSKRAWCAAVLFAACVAGTACNTESPARPAPPAPADDPPPPPPSTGTGFTVSGIAVDYSGAPQPRAGVLVEVLILSPPAWTRRTVTTDGTGRFEVNDVTPRAAIIIAPPNDADYRAPCPAGTDGLRADQTFTVNIVSRSTLVSTGVPASLPRSAIWFSGMVFETLPSGRHPVAGATIQDAGDDSDRWVYSSTVSDAAGRFLICTSPPGVGTDQESWIRVSKEGFRPASRKVLGGWDYGGVDVELVRR